MFTEFSSLFMNTNRQRWDLNPRTQTVLEKQSNTLTTRPPCLTSETIKKNEAQMLRFKQNIFFAQNKKPIKKKPLFDQK